MEAQKISLGDQRVAWVYKGEDLVWTDVVVTRRLFLEASETRLTAAGGSSQITARLVTYEDDEQVESIDVIPYLAGTADGFAIDGLTITAAGRGTVVGGERQIAITGHYDGVESEPLYITQQENQIMDTTYEITLQVSDATVPAEGGSVALIASGKITYTYTSGATSVETFTPTLSVAGDGFTLDGTTVKVASRGTVVGAERSGTITASYAGAASKQIVIRQQLNEITGTYHVIGTLSANTGTTSATALAAGGGSATLTTSGTTTYTYSSNATSTAAFTPTLKVEGEGFTLSGTTVTAATRGTVTGAERSAIVTASYSNAEPKQLSLFQRLNEITDTANAITTLSANTATTTANAVPAVGGTVTITVSGTATHTYTSGSTSTSSISPGLQISGEGFTIYGNIVTVANRTTVVGALRQATVTATYTGAANKTLVIYQVANQITNTANAITTLSANTATTTANAVPAVGGTVTITVSGTATHTYTSGSTSTSSISPGLQISGEGFTIYGNIVTVANRTTVVGALRQATVTATYLTATKEITLWQQANKIESYDYGNWSVSLSVSPTTYTAAGGTGTVTSLASRSATPVYSSGSRGPATTDTASPAVAVTGAGFTLSGTTITVANRTTVAGAERTAQVTATHAGVSATPVTLKQLINEIMSYTYGAWNVSVSVSPASYPAKGGTGTVTHSASRTKTPVYSSGSSGTATTETGTPTLSLTGAGFTLSGTTLTVASRGTTAATTTRSATITAAIDGVSKQATATQALNAVIYRAAGINLRAATNPMAYTAGSTTITSTCTVTEQYSSEEYAYQYPTVTPTMTANPNSAFTLSGTTLSVTANSGTATRSCTLRSAYTYTKIENGVTTANTVAQTTLTVTQNYQKYGVKFHLLYSGFSSGMSVRVTQGSWSNSTTATTSNVPVSQLNYITVPDHTQEFTVAYSGVSNCNVNSTPYLSKISDNYHGTAVFKYDDMGIIIEEDGIIDVGYIVCYHP